MKRIKTGLKQSTFWMAKKLVFKRHQKQNRCSKEWILDFNFSQLIYSKSKLNWTFSQAFETYARSVIDTFIYLFGFMHACTFQFNSKTKQNNFNTYYHSLIIIPTIQHIIHILGLFIPFLFQKTTVHLLCWSFYAWESDIKTNWTVIAWPIDLKKKKYKVRPCKQ